jgi:hypothetical protein
MSGGPSPTAAGSEVSRHGSAVEMPDPSATTTLKRPLSAAELIDVLRPVGEVRHVQHLDGGLFASVARVQLAHRVVAVKTGPPDGTTAMLDYERGVMRAEAEVLTIGSTRPALRLPELVHADFTRSVVDVDVLVTAFLEGDRWDACWERLHPDANISIARETGAALAAYASIRGPRFGFVSERAPEFSAATWERSFSTMLRSVTDVAERAAALHRAADVRTVLERHRPSLRRVNTPRLVHGDLWSGNTIVDANRGVVSGVIDPERALWGDPLFDLAGTSQMTIDPPSRDIVAGMTAAGSPPRLDEHGLIRLDLYRTWFAVAMLAEAGCRAHLIPDRAARDRRLLDVLDVLLDRLGAAGDRSSRRGR